MLPLLLTLLTLLPQPNAGVLRDRVDLAELNHFYDDNGKLVFDQVIWYEWAGRPKTFVVYDWRLAKENVTVQPQRDWERGGYVSLFVDGAQLREVRAGAYRETWTQYDVELAEREILPKERRHLLSASH